MPGWGRRSAQDAVAETGVDMTRFRTGGAPVLLGREDPAGQPVRQAHRTRQVQEGQPVPGRRHRRDRRRSRPDPDPRRRPLPAAGPAAAARPKPCVAVGNTQLKVYHKLLSDPGMRYKDLGPDYYERQRDIRRQIAHHVGKLGALGFEVTLCRIPEPDPDGTGPTQAA